MEGLTSKISLDAIEKLYNECFDANSLFDRISYVLSIKFNMPKFGDWFHHNVAHVVVGDKFADGIEAYGELRNDLFYRGELTAHYEDYENLSKTMESFVLKISNIEKLCVQAIHVCADNGDEGFEDFLRTLNVDNISPMLKQAIVFYNAAVEYEKADALYKWNRDFESYIIL